MKPTCEELEAEVARLNALVEQLMQRIADLESQLKKNSKNSSKPLSSDQKSNLPPVDKKGIRPFHPGALRQLPPEIDKHRMDRGEISFHTWRQYGYPTWQLKVAWKHCIDSGALY